MPSPSEDLNITTGYCAPATLVVNIFPGQAGPE